MRLVVFGIEAVLVAIVVAYGDVVRRLVQRWWQRRHPPWPYDWARVPDAISPPAHHVRRVAPHGPPQIVEPGG